MKLWLVILTILLVFIYLWGRIEIVNKGYEIEGYIAKRNDLEKINKKLKSEIASFTSLVRVEKRAVNELGLSKPEPGQIIMLKINHSPKGDCIRC